MRRLISKPSAVTADKAKATNLRRETPASKTRLPRVKTLFLGFVGLTLAATATLGYMDRERLINDMLLATGKAGLNLQYIQVRGRAHTPKDILMAATDLHLGDPILGINIDAVHKRVSDIGWVEDVIVERRMPSTIRISIRERLPMGLLQTVAGHQLIDAHGVIINDAKASDFTHLPVVAGNGSAVHADKILSVLKTEPELFAEVWAISFQSGRRWDVHLRNGIEIRLPEVEPRQAWSRLAVMDRRKQIINRDLAVIDLRIPEQLIVEPNIPVRGKGKST
ncbi:MAG: FtsQ-type POTRA domain-containing protein [Candidatus Puniceispirillum sp.]|jgi:cell division protein FtsQ|uniref:cell division protein FtsQ/DivIB n=1 Tax=Candidatus Puniceispirillum sp. TaxID=2026719 RepID=UPI001EBA31D7|nr:FtsQ-type POTRA domain-containing protein [Candidatus Puniceispirillum sp.]MBT6415075.1 FtsQ-type POTRA domain-containing protein [Candidatus Puniceispirillum sp.]MBT6565827.1 FtsQ-type POTRA domain-containing protein [Candidatus Puniceispirillum sp.]